MAIKSNINISSKIMYPLVSIITAVKNGEKYLEESLSSILNQTYANFELIVIDDYSTDATIIKLKNLAFTDSRVRLLSNQGLAGLANALNLGIEHAKGSYLVRHDADDISKPNRLEVQIAYLQKNRHIDILGSYIEMIGESGEFVKLHREPLSHAAIVFHTIFGTPFAHPSIVIRKSFFDKCALSYLEVPAQDYELWVRMINAGAQAENIPEPLVSYRVSSGSDSNVRYFRHHLMAEAIKFQQVLRYTRFANQVKKITSLTFQAIAHYLLTGNEVDFNCSSKKTSQNVVKFFIEIFPQMHLHDKEKNQLIAIMSNRHNAIDYTCISFEGFKKLSHSFLRGIKKANVDKATPIIKMTDNESRSFIERVHVFIIVRDRLTCLQTLVNWLARAGHKNLILIDNASTYPPLLEYLSNTPYKVISLKENLGHTALWQIPELKEIIRSNWYVYTDPDVIPDESCPVDAVARFYTILLNHPYFVKAGFGLRIDDIPDHYHLKDKVIKWEAQYYKNSIEPNLYNADIDTTFALYRPGTPYSFGPALRTAGIYKARHLPWYLNTNRLNEDELYYRKHALPSVTTWNVIGDVKSLPLPTTWSNFKNKMLVIASHNSVSYKFAIQTKKILEKLKILR